MIMCSGSAHMLRYLMTAERGQDSCVTDDPEKADLFVYPLYESCYNSTACAGYRCFQPTFDPSRDLPYWSRRQGMDHVFFHMCNLLPFSDNLMQMTRQSIYVTPESFQSPENRRLFAWFNAWKDVMMPGVVPYYAQYSMAQLSKGQRDRKSLVSFFGNTRNNHMSYTATVMSRTTRERLIEELKSLRSFPRANVVEGYNNFYYSVMGDSRFCFVPAGLTAWSVHLFESFFHGCIPVIISDESLMPFQDLMDWNLFSIKVPRTADFTQLYHHLEAIPYRKRVDMQGHLINKRCWFDYSRWTEHDCSPYVALLWQLAARHKQLVSRGGALFRKMPQFWGLTSTPVKYNKERDILLADNETDITHVEWEQAGYVLKLIEGNTPTHKPRKSFAEINFNFRR